MQKEFCNSIWPSQRYKYYKVYLPSLRSASVPTLVSSPCLVFVRIFRKILFGVCLMSGFCPYSWKLYVVCLSGRTRMRQSYPNFHCPCPSRSDKWWQIILVTIRKLVTKVLITSSKSVISFFRIFQILPTIKCFKNWWIF